MESSGAGSRTTPATIVAGDGVELEAEVAMPDAPFAGAVLCHPHPLHGGNMRSVVIGALFESLPTFGVACVRFNFRGVEGSAGEYSAGDRERLDADAALAHLVEVVPTGTPVAVVGWSFGGDVALSVTDETHRGWMAVAPPLKFAHDLDVTASDARPKLVALAQHDQFRDPADVADELSRWQATRVEVVGGADHFFIGRTDRLVAFARDFVDTLAETPEK